MPRDKHSSKSVEKEDLRYDAIKKIVSHSLDPDTALVTLTVLVKGTREDISEWDVQEHRPSLLFDYWASFKGRTRQDVLGIGELYHPYRFLRHRRVRGQWQVLVQWLGYSEEGEDVSWEPAVKMRVDAPDVMTDYCGYVDDDSAKAALLGPMPQAEDNVHAALAKAGVKSAAENPMSATKQTTKRKRDSLNDQPQSVADKRRRSSRYDSTPATKSPVPKPSVSKKAQLQASVDSPIPSQMTPKSNFASTRQSNLAVGAISFGATSSAHAQPPSRRKSLRASSVATPSTTASRRLSPADVPRTMLWFMDDFTVGDMQKVCRFIDENCTGKLRLPLYSGGDWDGKAASGRWEDVFMVSPLGRLGRYDNEDEKEE
ncbi:Putative chromo/chromo shadow domain, Chromo-like domain superfamily protein [Colletotrichum destructivum]|uniref:Chromo/chromo shadow domain, Chromo-like domain superfamily protein n=1 Tax=Colletotrichum destructivum TaxID=34406 RepID=A0AAX4IDF6_9PEZI|nr:Putative chromo/chromo shadow domain, Chromo-like domain superfamily protein [Colletotrichum destructivum]